MAYNDPDKLEQWKKNNPERLRSYENKWAEKNPEKRAANKKRHYEKYKDRYQQKAREYNAKNKEKRREQSKARYERIRFQERERRIQKQFGWSPEQFNALFAKQQGRCAICARQFTAVWGVGKQKSQRPHIDHDHSTGKVRGLLCSSCNMAIGLLSDNVATVFNAACYLERPPNG